MSTTYFDVQEHISDAAHIREYPRALAGKPDDVLKLHIKQYTPKQLPRISRAVTIIGAHANAFPKELYEPFWDELYERCITHGFEISSIWIADMAWQGQSAALNDGRLGNDPNWFDHSRDLLHVINTFRHKMVWPLVGIGHSMGGCQITNLALFHPRLFASLILIDPVIGLSEGISGMDVSGRPKRHVVAWYSLYRKEVWSSREEAASSFRKSPFYQAWNPRVLDLWIKYGLRDLPTVLYPKKSKKKSPSVALATPKTQEVWSFLRPNYEGQDADGKPIVNRLTHPDVDPESKLIYPFYRPEQTSIYPQLPYLRPPTFYLMGGESNLGSREDQYRKVPLTGTGIGGSGGEKEGKVSHVFIEGVGHLIPMLVPDMAAEIAAKWLGTMLVAWFKEEEEFQKSWSQISVKEKMSLDKAWFDHLGPPPSRANKQNKL